MEETAFHPDANVLAEYAMGTLSPGRELLVSGHLTFCAACRGHVERYEEIGGAQLDVCDTDVGAPSLEATLAMIENAPSPEPVVVQPGSIVPAALQRYVGADVDALNWSFRLPGIHEHVIEGFENEAVSLIRGKPGSKMLSHTHDGDEATLILSGQMKDGNRVYTKGDVSMADHNDDHKPHIIGNEMCICLIVMSGSMKFTGTLSRALNLLT